MMEYSTWSIDKDSQIAAIGESYSGNIWSRLPRGHKWLGYFSFYDREFGKYVVKSPRVLEIGVYRVASLYLWRRFFGDGATVVGIDLQEVCHEAANAELSVFVEVGDQSAPDFLKDIVQRYGPFDLMVDDGSYVAFHQIASFNNLFLEGLNETGLYYVEDLECMHWSHRDEFRDTPITSTEFFQTLVHAQNNTFEDYHYENFLLYHPSVSSDFRVLSLAKHLGSIKFARSVVLIEKAPQKAPALLHL